MTEEEYGIICQKIINGCSVRCVLPGEKERSAFRRLAKRKNDSIGLVVKKRKLAQQRVTAQAVSAPVLTVPSVQVDNPEAVPLIEVEKKIDEQLTKRLAIGPVTSEGLLTRAKELIAFALETNPNPAWAKLALEICKQELPAWRGDTKSTPADYKLVLDELIAPEPIRLQVLQRKDTKEAI